MRLSTGRNVYRKTFLCRSAAVTKHDTAQCVGVVPHKSRRLRTAAQIRAAQRGSMHNGPSPRPSHILSGHTAINTYPSRTQVTSNVSSLGAYPLGLTGKNEPWIPQNQHQNQQTIALRRELYVPQVKHQNKTKQPTRTPCAASSSRNVLGAALPSPWMPTCFR